VGSKVNLLNAIYLRLNTAIGAGKTLASVKRVQVGSREEARRNNDLPIINIQLDSGEEINEGQPNCKRDEMTIHVSLVVAKLDSTTENHLYNTTAGGSGALYLFEDLLDAIDNTTSDALDLTFGDTAGQIPVYSYDVEYHNGLIEFVIELKIQTADFTSGSR